MNKLEEKLIELGYKQCPWKKERWDSIRYNIVLYTNQEVTKVEDSYVWINQIRRQSTIDFVQVSFNKMQKDLEDLRKYEKKD